MEPSEGGGSALFQLGPDDQIKHRDRVRDLAEVYTHQREVTAMLDLVPEMFPSEDDPDNLDKTFLEPAAGHGNFLVEILRRKLAAVAPGRYRGEEFEHRILRCLASIYGIDIDPENVDDSRRRMHAVIAAHVGDPSERTAGFWSAVETILTTNIVRADTLADARVIELVAYQPRTAGTFVREWSTLEEPQSDSQLDLFATLPDELQRDAVPVHYTQLAANPKPTAARGRKR
ncbi:type III restriction endonuclease subunit M [Mycobacterium avium subsp. hominissuis]|uniref:Type III restriction endonuclease subunit M n=1 Tax=Mycobacterium avium subsp. hominissuis TaxID=439334 RepID=A0A3B6X4Y2_MYCAV|nr:type III restriction endonuclease subunit M [Mycobacterium avium]AXO22171.1 type III restriction endonuclease subunit M [Mycobacterium avium subsp. hominissuis]